MPKLEEFTGPSKPGEFTLFVMPPRQKYREQLLAQIDALREGVESGEIQELAYVALTRQDWSSHYTGSESRLRMAGAIMDLAMDRLGYNKGQ